MLLTTKSSYGIRALIDLAIMYDRQVPISIKNISREEGISRVYLEQILNRLKKQGFVKSVRGPKGGYMLAKDPSGVSVYEVVMALEGSVAPGKCISGKGKIKVCERAGRCASKDVWNEVAKQIKKTLEGFSLRSLARRTLQIDPHKLEKVQDYEKSIS